MGLAKCERGLVFYFPNRPCVLSAVRCAHLIELSVCQLGCGAGKKHETYSLHFSQPEKFGAVD